MDLYSGRLSSSEEELALFKSATIEKDTKRIAVPVDPLRVVLAGQTSSGKSSLINALVENLQAETDILPTTDTTTIHELRTQTLDNDGPDSQIETATHLVDTIGLSEEPESINNWVAEALQADIIIWVLRATQPARNAEARALEALKLAVTSTPGKRLPPMLVALTHIDLLKPKAHWQPPYDLRGDDPKAQSILAALNSCLKQTGLDDKTCVVPVSLLTNHPAYNIEALSSQLMLLHDEATQAQYNRRRVERNHSGGSWRERWDQASRLGTVTGKVVARAILK